MAKSPEKPRKPRKESGGRANWGRRILTLLIAVAAVGGFAMIVVYSYDRGNQPGDDGNAPVIEARSGPTKIRPAEPGGMIIPNQDKQIYERLEKDATKKRVETLLPPPEPIIAKPPPPAQVSPPSPPKATPPADKPATVAEVVKTAPAAGPAPIVAAPPPPPPPPKTVVAARTPPSAPLKTAPVKPVWRAQIASLRSEKAANAAWSRLAKRHAALLRGMEPHVVRADLKKRGIYYRLQVGPLASRADAAAFCKGAKAQKVGCLIVKP